jgi:hypothetical protein
MPRFFFHYRDPDDELTEDRLGSQLRDLAAAEAEGHLLAREIIEEELAQGGPVLGTRSLEIADETGEIVLLMPFWASVSIGPAGGDRGGAPGRWLPNHIHSLN